MIISTKTSLKNLNRTLKHETTPSQVMGLALVSIAQPLDLQTQIDRKVRCPGQRFPTRVNGKRNRVSKPEPVAKRIDKLSAPLIRAAVRAKN